MLTNYVKEDELLRFYSVANFADAGEIPQRIISAVYIFSQELRRRGVDPATVQPPRMFDSLAALAKVSKSADYTSASLTGGNESRFVFNVTSGSGSVELLGSIDDSTWYPVKGLDGNPIIYTFGGPELFTTMFYEKYTYYKYAVTTADIEYCPYLVDASVDACIMAKAVELLMLPVIDQNTTAKELYQIASTDYEESLRKLVMDADVDSDGDVDEGLGYKQTILAMR